ncbi:target of rapamycin (TOR) kinase 1 [Trypanosoma grayi]|uniref:target of rapamycin (TOR) kinase 1 n=1 Tax=Trypanosoma grayi TaxID=71804 RepID=UPI0004F3F741|nr:target of rapamycin (TOR) kinase 1 [Trypanosoma grayi]KEG13500.1 target of rapamycin (TOR) kinase 1 [Trypanosoma grayi]
MRRHVYALTRYVGSCVAHRRRPSRPRSPICVSQSGARSLLKTSGVISAASTRRATGCVVPFTVVEDKPTGRQRRFIAWPGGLCDEKDYEAQVPLGHISQNVTVDFDETSTLLYLKASFSQVALPKAGHANFRCRTEYGEHVEVARRPMGKKMWF